MSKFKNTVLRYLIAFSLGIVTINIGFCLIPVYKILSKFSISKNIMWGPFSLVFIGFIFGLPFVVFYIKKYESLWKTALIKGAIIVFVDILVLAIFNFIILSLIK